MRLKSMCSFVKGLSLFVLLIMMFLTGYAAAGEEAEKSGNASSSQAESAYRIGAGDVLSIKVWKESDLSLDSVRVRIDGKITFPLLDDLQAAGQTTMMLKNKIQSGLEDFVEAPTVTVTLLSPESKKFYIIGEVMKTGEYPIVKELTVMQAFALAGGFTEWASKKEILVFRKEGETRKTITIDYRDIVKGDFSKNILIRPDDTVVVP